MSDKKYLVQRRQGWYVQVRVPDSLYHIVGKRKITRSLHTTNLQEARSRRWAKVKEIKAYLDEAKKQLEDYPAPDTPQGIVESAKQFRREVDLGLHGDPQNVLEDARHGLELQAEDYFRPSGRAAVGVPIDAETGYREDADPDVAKAYKLALRILAPGKEVHQLASEALGTHLEDLRIRNRRESTIAARERKVMDFIKWKGGEVELSKITPQDAGRYRAEVLLRSGRSLKTIKDAAADLKAFGGWCVDSGYIESNPFERIAKRLEDTSRGLRTDHENRRRPWKENELVKLLKGIKEKRGTDDPLWALTVIALYTGMRGNEIAELRKTDIHLDASVPHLKVAEGKTKSSIRDLPLHPHIIPLVNKLMKEDAGDNYLIAGLSVGGADGKKFHGQSKRFATLTRRTLGITDPRLVFHSLRHTMITALIRSGASKDMAKQVHGDVHETRGSLSDYDHGYTLEQLAEAVGKVSYGGDVERLVGA